MLEVETELCLLVVLLEFIFYSLSPIGDRVHRKRRNHCLKKTYSHSPGSMSVAEQGTWN